MPDGFSSDGAERMVNSALSAAAREQSGTRLTANDQAACCPGQLSARDFVGELIGESSDEECCED
jgi:hypothetical protein